MDYTWFPVILMAVLEVNIFYFENLIVWDIRKDEILIYFNDVQSSITSVSWNKHNSYIVSGTSLGNIRVGFLGEI
jgi:WD40 repeat protein